MYTRHLDRIERQQRADADQANLLSESMAAEMRLALTTNPRTPVHYYTLGKEMAAHAHELCSDQWDGENDGPLVQAIELLALASKGVDIKASAAMWIELRCRKFAANNLDDAMFVLGGGDDEF